MGPGREGERERVSTQTVTQAYFRMLMEQMYKPVGGGVSGAEGSPGHGSWSLI